MKQTDQGIRLKMTELPMQVTIEHAGQTREYILCPAGKSKTVGASLQDKLKAEQTYKPPRRG